jgi:Integrase core domain
VHDYFVQSTFLIHLLRTRKASSTFATVSVWEQANFVFTQSETSGQKLSLGSGKFSKVAFAKLYDRKKPITAADFLNDRVVPFFEAQEVKLCRMLTDRGTEYCGNPEHHEYQLYLAIENFDHSRTKTKWLQTNGIVERFYKTVLDEFYRIAFRKKIYGAISELQVDLDAWLETYNEDRPHQGRWCFGKTPMQTFLDATPLAKEKLIAA